MTIRDADRFKDKVEVSLDGRQIFFLFFGGAVVASLVFVLGVMVGKRLEARDRVAQRASTSAQLDPLAALDELGADEQRGDRADDLAFPTALAGDAPRTKPLGNADVAPAAPPPPAPVPAAKPAAPAPKPPEVAVKPEAPKKGDKEKDKDKDKDRDKSDPKKKFTLQISSFQAKSEADAFVAKLSAQGFKPYVVTSDVPDRGVFYRVRLGEYASHEDALSAKTAFEKSQRIIAYVTRL